MFLIIQVFNTYLLEFISETFMIFLLFLVLVNCWVIAHTNSTYIYSLIKKIHYLIFPYTIIFPFYFWSQAQQLCLLWTRQRLWTSWAWYARVPIDTKLLLWHHGKYKFIVFVYLLWRHSSNCFHIHYRKSSSYLPYLRTSRASLKCECNFAFHWTFIKSHSSHQITFDLIF